MLQDEVVSTASPEIVNNTPNGNSVGSIPVVTEAQNATSKEVITKPTTQSIPVEPEPIDRLRALHEQLRTEMNGVPEDFTEFQKALTPERLQGVYEFVKQKYNNAPSTFNDFTKAVGFIKIPGVDQVSEPKLIPHNFLTETASGEKKIPFSDILIKDIQLFPNAGELPTTEVAKNAWEYMGNLAGKFNTSILKTLDYVGDLQTALQWAVVNPSTLNPFHAITDEEQRTGNAIMGVNKLSPVNPLTGGVSVKGMTQWLKEKGVGGKGQKELPGKDVPAAVNAVEFPMKFANVHEENFMAQGLSSLASISGELMQMGVMLTVKAGKVLSAIGMEYVPKAPVFFGTLGVRDSDKSTWYGPYKGLMEGVINGVEMDALGGLAQKWGKGIVTALSGDARVTAAKLLENPSVKFNNALEDAQVLTKAKGVGYIPSVKMDVNGNPVYLRNAIVREGEPILNPLALETSIMGTNAALFAGDDVLQQMTDIATSNKTMKDYDVNRTGQVGFQGMAMSTLGLPKGAFSSFVEMRGRQVRANMMSAWMTTERNVGEKILQSNISPEGIRVRIDELNRTISTLPKEAGEVRIKAEAERNLLNNVVAYNAQAKEVLRDPDAFRMMIKNDPNMPETAKQFLYNKVEETLQIGDPTYAKANRIQAEMDQIKESIPTIENDKTLTPEKVEAKKAAAMEQLGKLKTELKDVYSKESFWLNGEEFNSESEFRAAVGKAKTTNDLSNALVRNSPKVAEWVRQKQLDMATDEIKYGIRSQELIQQDIDVDARIAEFQTKTGSSTLPNLIIPDRVNTIIDRMDRGETVSVEHVQEASDILYGEYKRLEALKQSNDPVIKRYTTEQIERAQEFLKDDITNAENYVNRSKGGNAPNRAEIERIEAERDRVQAAKDAELAEQVQVVKPAGGGTEAGGAGVSQEMSLGLAPYRETNVTSIEHDQILRDSPEYVQHQKNIDAALKLVGVKLLGKQEIWGGWVDTKTGKPVQEVSQFLHVDATPEQAKLLAAIMGKASPEAQNAVMIGNHSLEGKGDKHTIETGSFENGVKALEYLKDNNLEYFSMDKNTGEIIIMDQDGGNMKNILNFVTQLNENGIKTKHYGSKVDVSFLGSDEYDGVLAEARNNPSAGNRGDIDAFIEKARRGYETLRQSQEVERTKKEKGNLVLAAGVDEVSAFLGDRLFEGETPSVDRAVTEMAKELSVDAKSPEEVFQGVKDVLDKSVAGNDWAMAQVERLVNDRADLIREVYEGLQPSTETAITKKGEVTNLRGEISRIKQEEQSYRATLKEQIAREIESAKARGEYVTTAGLSGEELNLYAKLATSYIREGAKTAKAVYDAMKVDIKEITGKSFKKEDFDEMMEHTPKGETGSPHDLLDIYDEIRTRGKQEKVDKGKKTPEQVQIEKETAVRKEKTRVLVDEYSTMKDEIKLQQIAAIEAKKSEQNVVTSSVNGFKDWIKKNKDRIDEIAPELSTVMANRLSVVRDQQSMNSAIEYIDAALHKTEFAKRARVIDQNRKRAVQNLNNGKFGSLYPEVEALTSFQYKKGKYKYDRVVDPVTGDIKRILSVSESNIPNRLLPAYDALLEQLAQRGEIDVNAAEVRNMVDALQETINLNINKRLREQESRIKLPSSEKVADIEKIRQSEKITTHETLLEIDNIDSRFLSKDEARLLGEVRRYTLKDLEGLTTTQLRKARLIIEHARDNGWVSNKLYEDVVKPVRQQRVIDKLAEGYDWAKVNAIGKYKDTKQFQEVTDMAKEFVEGKIDHVKLQNKLKRIPMDQLDMVLQGGVSTPIYTSIHHPFNIAISKMDADIKGIEKGMQGLVDKVLRDCGSSREKKAIANVQMSMYVRAREYFSNKDNPKAKVKPLKDYVDGVIQSKIDRRSKELVQKVYESIPKTAEGEVDMKTFTDTYLTQSQKNLITYTDNVDRVMLNPALRFATTHYRGDAYVEIKDHSYRMAEVDIEGQLEGMIGGGGFGGISTTAGSSHARVGANTVSFDFLGSFMRGVRQTMTDYHLTPVVKETFGTLRLLKKQHAKNINATEMVQTVENMYHDNLKFQLADAMVDKTIPTKLMKAMINGSYNSALAGIGRVGSELPSNISSAIIYDPISLMRGEQVLRRYSGEQWDNLYETLGTSHMNRLGAQGDEFARMLSNDVHRLSADLGASLGERTVDFLNDNWMRQQVTHINKGLIQFSDNTVAKPFWAGTFTKEFKRFTGKEFNMEEFSNSPEYFKKYEQNMKDAAALADHHTTLMFNSAQGFDRALGTKTMPQDPWWLLKTVNNFLVGYGRREYYSSMMGIKAMMYNNQGISREQGAKLLTAILVRNTVYTVAMQQMNQYKNQLLSQISGVEQEEEKGKSIKDPQDLRRLGMSTAANVVTGRFGQFARTGIAYGLNGLEQMYTEKVLDETYDQYKHAIMYTKGNIFTNPDNTKAWLGILGPMSFMTNALYDGVKLGGEIKSQFEDEDWLDGFKNAATDKGVQMQSLDFGFQLLNLMSVVPINREVKQITNFLKYNAEDMGTGDNVPKNIAPKSVKAKKIITPKPIRKR